MNECLEKDYSGSLILKLYYMIRPLLPRRIQIAIRRTLISVKRRRNIRTWPILQTAGQPPDKWEGWPEKKRFALVLTHDVEHEGGQEKVVRLSDYECSCGMRSAFFFVPERYKVSAAVRKHLTDHGFEVGVHGLRHDGKLFKSFAVFSERAKVINQFLAEWNAVGFRAPAMHHNLSWNCLLDIAFDASTFDTDPFEPQPDGIGTVFPMKISSTLRDGNSYIELPYTLPQDFLLFVMMKERTVDIWKKKLDWIAQCGGMALINTHPDYMSFNASEQRVDTYPFKRYQEFLSYVQEQYKDQYWLATPGEVAAYVTDKHIRYYGFSGEDCKPMRVCMLAYTFYIKDNRVRRYAEALAERGNEVHVLSLREEEDQPSYEMLRGVHIHRIQRRVLNERKKITYLLRLLRFLLVSGVIVTKKHLCERRFDLIHVHSVPDFEVFAALVPKLMGTKVILDVHDLVPELYISKFHVAEGSLIFRMLLWIEKISIWFSNYVIIANHIWEKRLKARSAHPDRVGVFLNYPDESIFTYHKPEPKNNADVTLLYPGSLNWHQGVDVAVRAFARIHEKVPHAKFIIYGEGPQYLQICEIVETLGLQERISVYGTVRLDEVPEIMRSADIGVVPKRKDSFGNEAFSTKIFEFMTMGVPVIAADTAIDKYYFNDSVIQFFSSGDDVDLAEKMLMLINDQDYRRQLAENARAFVSENSWTHHKKRYFQLVDALVDSKKNKGTA